MGRENKKATESWPGYSIALMDETGDRIYYGQAGTVNRLQTRIQENFRRICLLQSVHGQVDTWLIRQQIISAYVAINYQVTI